MARKKDLINSIATKVKILKEELVETKPDGAKQYLLYIFRNTDDDAGVYEHKTLYVWNEGKPNETAKWSGNTPYQTTTAAFSKQVRTKIAELITKGIIKAGFLDKTDDELKNAIVNVVMPDDTQKQYLVKEKNGSIVYEQI